MPRLLLILVICCGCSSPTQEAEQKNPFQDLYWIDLGHDFSAGTVYWPNNPDGFKLDTQFNGMTEKGYYYSSNEFYSPEHGGTHLDAPVHFAAGRWSVDQIPLNQMMGDVLVIDVSEKSDSNADYQASIADIESWEKQNGKIEDSIIILIRTGWSKYYNDTEKYLGTAEKGQEAVSKLHFPSIDPALAEWLIKNRKIKAVGIDCPSVDYGQSTDFRTHQILYAQNIPGFENLTNLDKLPARGGYIIALPMKIKGGTGAPLRIIGTRLN